MLFVFFRENRRKVGKIHAVPFRSDLQRKEMDIRSAVLVVAVLCVEVVVQPSEQ